MWEETQKSRTRLPFPPSVASPLSISLFSSIFIELLSSPASTYPIIFLFPLYFHLISPPLLLFTFILLKNSSFGLSHPIIPSSLSPHLYITFFPPLLFREPLSSRPLKHSRLSCPLPGQGSTTAYFTHDRVCCMSVMYAARGGATDGEQWR